MITIKKCLLNPTKSLNNARFTRFASQLIQIGIVDAPLDKGQKKLGVGDGPKSIRNAGLVEKLSLECGTNVKDYGFTGTNGLYQMKYEYIPKNMTNYEHVINFNQHLSKTVQTVMKDGRICLTLGGDHSLGFGTVSGHCATKGGDNVALIWVDAHADLNTNTTSGSGNIHGMSVALLASELRPYWANLPRIEWHCEGVPLKNIAYIGLRSIDVYEEWIIQKMGITCYDIFDVQKLGIHTVIREVLQSIDPEGTKSIHLSFDIDAIDPCYAPSTGTPVAGGLLLREGIYIANAVHQTGRLGAMDLVEVNPTIGSKDDVEKTLQSAIEIICAAFGYGKRGLKPDLPDLKPIYKEATDTTKK